MPAMAELANEFSWSRSRDATFHDCRRRYFYQYYGAWGGWETTAPEEVRRLYRTAVEERYRFYSFGDAMLLA